MSDTTGLIERAARARSAFSTVNPHCLQSIVRLAQEMTLVACCDLVDEDGTTLCASGATVSRSIELTLGERRLQQPLETSLELVPGISPAVIADDCLALMRQTPALALLAGSGRAAVARVVGKLPLSGPLALLLCIARQFNPASYQNSLAAMIVCAGLADGLDLAEQDAELLILAALVKDVGESYLNPQLIDGRLPAREWQQVAAHPAIGHAFLTAFTDFPPALAECVLQHHERGDGSGYPRQLAAAQIDPLATLVGLADCVAALVMGGAGEFALDARLGSCLGERVAVALTLIPGEFPPAAVAVVAAALAPLAEAGSGIAGGSFAQRILPTLQQIRSARLLAEALAQSAPTPGLATIGSFSLAAIRGLDKSLRATGVYDLSQLGVLESDAQLMGKTCLIVDEVGWRLRHLARNVYLRSAQNGEDLAPVAELVAILSAPD
ncbi:MAG: hypothetical protein H6R17_464 [Proteobacteria bacterium]|nr:hypothetical protein [Pseudomonadota bacterium]